MILSDSTPTPGLFEYKQIVSPIRLGLTLDRAGNPALAVANLRHTASASDVVLRWRVEHNGVLAASGELAANGTRGALQAGESATLTLPPVAAALDGETWLSVRGRAA